MTRIRYIYNGHIIFDDHIARGGMFPREGERTWLCFERLAGEDWYPGELEHAMKHEDRRDPHYYCEVIKVVHDPANEGVEIVVMPVGSDPEVYGRPKESHQAFYKRRLEYHRGVLGRGQALPSVVPLNNESEERTVGTLCETIGYGRVMQLASQLWHRKDPTGAVSMGVCYGSMIDLDDDHKSTFRALFRRLEFPGNRDYFLQHLGQIDGDVPGVLFAAAELLFDAERERDDYRKHIGSAITELDSFLQLCEGEFDDSADHQFEIVEQLLAVLSAVYNGTYDAKESGSVDGNQPERNPTDAALAGGLARIRDALEPAKWFDVAGNPKTFKEVLEANYPLKCPSDDEAEVERGHARTLIEEGGDDLAQSTRTWCHKLLRAYLYADRLKRRVPNCDGCAKDDHCDMEGYAHPTCWEEA